MILYVLQGPPQLSFDVIDTSPSLPFVLVETLQSEMLRRSTEMEHEDELLVPLAGLKQVRGCKCRHLLITTQSDVCEGCITKKRFIKLGWGGWPSHTRTVRQ